MANSIQFDSTEILTSAYIPQFVKHETVTERILTSLSLARQDGSVLIADRRGIKTIQLQGTLVASTQANLDAAIDAFDELFSRKEKNLDISWNGATRRYVATCTSHKYDRDHYHTNAVPWTAEFTVLSGEGKDTSATTALSAHAVTTTTPGTDSFTMSGGKAAKPYITIHGNSFPISANGIEYKDTDTGEKMVICKQTALSTGDYFYIDCYARKVYFSPDNVTLTEYPFYGVFPTFKVGTNNVQISVGDLVNQSSSETALTGSGSNLTSTTFRNAQAFSVPYTDATFKSITIGIYKTGTTMGAVTWRIETDTAGSPSGSLVTANATGTIAYASITGSATYITSNATGAFSLTSNTKYWLVFKAAATLDGSNYYTLETQANIYPRGVSKMSTDSGVTYATSTGYQYAFRINYGGNAGASTIAHTVTYTKTYL